MAQMCGENWGECRRLVKRGELHSTVYTWTWLGLERAKLEFLEKLELGIGRARGFIATSFGFLWESFFAWHAWALLCGLGSYLYFVFWVCSFFMFLLVISPIGVVGVEVWRGTSLLIGRRFFVVSERELEGE